MTPDHLALNRAKLGGDNLFAEVVNHHASKHDENHSNSDTVTGTSLKSSFYSV